MKKMIFILFHRDEPIITKRGNIKGDSSDFQNIEFSYVIDKDIIQSFHKKSLLLVEYYIYIVYMYYIYIYIYVLYMYYIHVLYLYIYIYGNHRNFRPIYFSSYGNLKIILETRTCPGKAISLSC